MKNFQNWMENKEAQAISSIPMYRGARNGSPKVLNGPSYFISSEIFAKTYGPTAEFRLNLRFPKIVSNQEWHEFDSIAGNPNAIQELSSQGYDSAVNVRKTPSGESLYVVLLVDPSNARLIN